MASFKLKKKVLNMNWKVYEYDVLLSGFWFCGFLSPPPPPPPRLCFVFSLFCGGCCCLVLTVSLFVFPLLGRGIGHPPYLASRLKKVYGYTSTSSLCFHGRLQGELCLSRRISLDTVSSFQFFWH